jgi:hypothetical protein
MIETHSVSLSKLSLVEIELDMVVQSNYDTRYGKKI